MVLALKLPYKDGTHAFTKEDFSSLKFSSLFQDEPFPALTCFDELDETDSSDELLDCAIEILNSINNSNGFTVTGWYKKCVVNDQLNNGTNNSIAAGTIMIHPLHIC